MLNGHMYIEDNYDDIYHQMLRDTLHAPNRELVGMSYELTNPTSTEIDNSVRAFDIENAEKFYQWVLSGSSDMSIMKDITKRAIQFDREVDGRNPHYGPRIINQIDFVVDELWDNPGSRRACIMILDHRDKSFAIAKRDRNTIEYPCTVMLNYFIRDGYLNAHTTMRSNNMCSTVCYDNYNFCRLQEEILCRLNTRGDLLGREPRCHLGSYFHYILNAHIIPGEIKRSDKILEKRYGNITRLTA